MKEKSKKSKTEVIALDDLKKPKSTLKRIGRVDTSSESKDVKKKPKKDQKGSGLEFNIGDYVVIRSGTRFVYGQTVGNEHLVDSRKLAESDPESIRFDPRFDLIAVLGANPPQGCKAFGCTTDPYNQALDMQGLGRLDMFVEANKNELHELGLGIKLFNKVVDAHNLKSLLQRVKTFELRGARKKSAVYQSSFKKEEWHDKMVLTPAELIGDCVLESLIFGTTQNLWAHAVPKDVQLRWLLTYMKAKGLRRTKQEHLASLLEQYKRVQNWKDLRSNVEDALEPLVPIVQKAISSSRGLSASELDLIVKSKPERIEKLWPAWAELPTSSRDDIPMECLASSLAFFQNLLTLFLRGKKIPKDLTKLCTETMKSLQRF